MSEPLTAELENAVRQLSSLAARTANGTIPSAVVVDFCAEFLLRFDSQGATLKAAEALAEEARTLIAWFARQPVQHYDDGKPVWSGLVAALAEYRGTEKPPAS